MTYKTHRYFTTAVITTLSAYGIIPLYNKDELLINSAFVSLAMMSALLPDLDNPRSRIRYLIRGKLYVEDASNKASGRKVNHRNAMTHYPFFWILVSLAPLIFILYMSFMAGDVLTLKDILYVGHITAGFAIGALGHLLCDTLNPYGILLLAPFSQKRFSFGKIVTGSKLEGLFRKVLIAITIAMIFINIARAF